MIELRQYQKDYLNKLHKILKTSLKGCGHDGYQRLTSYSIINNKVEVIGNIYENPELLENKQ